jgi:membrane protease YdiL (CAAX protease family)
MDRAAIRATIRATLASAAILVTIVVASRLARGGFTGDVGGAVMTGIVGMATYLPAVFVVEEVLFRGAIDTYLHGAGREPDRASALYGSALWGLWHLPVASIGLGVLAIPYLLAVHCAIGYPLVMAWRRTGNLAVPGIAHALTDALRNAVTVL